MSTRTFFARRFQTRERAASSEASFGEATWTTQVLTEGGGELTVAESRAILRGAEGREREKLHRRASVEDGASRSETRSGVGPPSKPVCSVIVTTYERPRDLSKCLDSLTEQTTSDEFELIVVDNSPARTAEEIVVTFARRAAFPVTYVHESVAGIAAARNSGLRVAQGELIAFLDDDQFADSAWLQRLIEAQRATGADAVFGWVEPHTETDPGPLAEVFFEPLTRRYACPSGVVPRKLIAKLGTNNSLFASHALRGDQTFDPAFNLTGGEDSAVIRRLAETGSTLVWCREARVWEHVPPSRLTRRFLFERKFSSGQTRSRHFYLRGPRAYPKLAQWVGIGIVQGVVCALVGSASVLIAPTFSSRMFASSFAGAGKVLFFDCFVISRYRRNRPSVNRLLTRIAEMWAL